MYVYAYEHAEKQIPTVGTLHDVPKGFSCPETGIIFAICQYKVNSLSFFLKTKKGVNFIEN